MSKKQARYCPIKIIISNKVPSGTGGYLISGPPTSDKCARCGTDHGFAEALDRKLETLRHNLLETYHVEPKGDQ